jgi:hypothetical protein
VSSVDEAQRPGNGRATPGNDAEAARRAEWRRFVRDHHPDRGGDPELFARGVRAYREGRPLPGSAPAYQHLTSHRSPRGLGHVTRWARRRWDGWTRPPRVQ